MNSHPDSGAHAAGVLDVLAAWREQGADRLDPIRFHMIEALARRAAARTGVSRRVLDERLAQRMEAYRRDVDACRTRSSQGTPAEPGLAKPAPAEPAPAESMAEPAPAEAPESPLSAFVHELRTSGPRCDPLTGAAAPASAPPPGQGSYPELALLDYFRDTWGRYKTRRQLKQSEERVPENAGPLNSSLLVHRTLSLMREVSPEYLHQFLSYVDALAWVEQATSVDLLSDKDRARGAGRKAGRAPK
ncbi:DUF2894 domain-containing protein [Bordetella sputigena]|uniref:DUF2894 domain-containing protein n=1 Tax=Bordetella sputigena TaxID=1416810 RepID=UPI0039F0B9D8